MIALLLALAATPALAEDRPPPLFTGAGTPFTYGTLGGRATVGVFQPLTVATDPRTDLSTTGLVSLLAPRVEAKRTVLLEQDGDGRARGVAVVGRLGVPTLGLRLLQDTVLATHYDIPFTLVVGAGVVAGVHDRDWTVAVGVEGRAALPFGQTDLIPHDLPWFDPMIAPLTEGPVVAVRGVVTRELGGRVGLTLDTRLQAGALGADVHGRLFGVVRLSDPVLLGAGIAGAQERLVHPRGGQLEVVGRTGHLAPLLDLQVRL